MKYWRTLVVALVLPLLLASCGSDGPARAAQEWLEAVLHSDGATALRLTCSSERQAMQEAGVWSAAIQTVLQMAVGLNTDQVQVDMSELKYETLSQDGDMASVRVAGDLYVSLLGAAISEEIDQTWTMIRENGEWRRCVPLPKLSEIIEDAPPSLPQQLPPEDRIWSIQPVAFHEVERLEEWGSYHIVTPDPGWKFLTVELAVRNVSDDWAKLHDLNRQVEQLKVQTPEGYTYEALYQPVDGEHATYCNWLPRYVELPPGFVTWFIVGVPVPESATEFQLVLSDGTVHDMMDMPPVEFPVSSVGQVYPPLENNPIELEDAILSFDLVQEGESALRMENLHQGYDTTIEGPFYLIDARGWIATPDEPCTRQYAESLGAPQFRIGYRLTVGPGQVKEFQVTWPPLARPAYFVLQSEREIRMVP